MRIVVISLSILLISCAGPAYAHNHLTETRYCGEPARNKDGSIKRSRAVVEAFERLYPLPEEADRSEWQINHAIPLVCGGCDSVSNMVWMRKEAKTCADDWCQDRHEQETMCPQSFKH